jgi:hypothetical protein
LRALRVELMDKSGGSDSDRQSGGKAGQHRWFLHKVLP